MNESAVEEENLNAATSLQKESHGLWKMNYKTKEVSCEWR